MKPERQAIPSNACLIDILSPQRGVTATGPGGGKGGGLSLHLSQDHDALRAQITALETRNNEKDEAIKAVLGAMRDLSNRLNDLEDTALTSVETPFRTDDGLCEIGYEQAISNALSHCCDDFDMLRNVQNRLTALEAARRQG